MWRSLWKRLTNDRARAHRPRRSVSCSLQVEGLEERWTPAVLRPAIIDYAVGSIPLENVFVETNEGLYLKTWNGFQWQTPVNLGLPPGAGLPYGSPAAIKLGTNQYVFVIDSGGNLDYDFSSNGTTWSGWGQLGNPGAPLFSNGYSNPAVATFQVGSALHTNVYAIDQLGNLNLKSWNGSAWQNWVSLGNPGIQLNQNDSPAVINYKNYENVFATDIRGNLDYAYTSDGTHFTWVNLVNDGVPAYGEPTVINYSVGSVLHENVYLTDSNGNLATAYWDGSSWYWANLSNLGVPLVGTPAAINVTVGGVQHENVFVRDQSGNLDLDYWDGTGWHMTNMGYPSTGVFTDPAVTNVQVGLPVSTQHENVYVYDGADLYLRYWDGTSWQPWENLGLINK